MPKDSSGKFHLNKQRADASDRANKDKDKKPSGKSAPKPPGGMGHGTGGGVGITPPPAIPSTPPVVPPGVGSTSPVVGDMGTQGAAPIEHPGHAAVSAAAATDPGKHHMLMSTDQLGGVTMHHASPDGQVSGPHDFQNLEELKASMDQFLTEEQQEGMNDEYGGGEQSKHMGAGSSGISGLGGL